MMLSDDLSKFLNGAERMIAESVVNLEADLIRNTPVGDVNGGSLKAAWDTEKLRDGSWLISNSMDYADVIFNGRRQVPTSLGNMKWVGSLKGFTDGTAPLLQRHHNELDKRLDMLKG